jgi:hypothetical protein
MRGLFAGFVAAACLVALAGPALAKTDTVKGQIVDQECYLREKAVDSDRACAISCAKQGKPMALLTADGKVYEITGGLAANKNEKLVAHIHTVEITGEVTDAVGSSLSPPTRRR